MKVYTVTLFSSDDKRHTLPHIKVFTNRETAYKYYENIQLRAGRNMNVQEDSSQIEQAELEHLFMITPRGKMIQAHELDE